MFRQIKESAKETIKNSTINSVKRLLKAASEFKSSS